MNERLLSSLGDKMTFTIANTTGASKTIAILPANFQTLFLTEGAPNLISYKNPAGIVSAGIACDWVLDDGTLVANLTATADIPEMTIREFIKEVQTMGKTCINITVQSANSDVFNKSLKLMKRTALQGSSWKYLTFNTFRSVDQTATDKIVLKGVNIEMGPDTLMLFTIDTGRTVSFTFEFAS